MTSSPEQHPVQSCCTHISRQSSALWNQLAAHSVFNKHKRSSEVFPHNDHAIAYSLQPSSLSTLSSSLGQPIERSERKDCDRAQVTEHGKTIRQYAEFRTILATRLYRASPISQEVQVCCGISFRLSFIFNKIPFSNSLTCHTPPLSNSRQSVLVSEHLQSMRSYASLHLLHQTTTSQNYTFLPPPPSVSDENVSAEWERSPRHQSRDNR